MRFIYCILCFVFVSCSPKKNSQLPENFNKVISLKSYTLVVSYSNECPVCILYTSVLSQIINDLPDSKFQTIFLKVNEDEKWDFIDNHDIFVGEKPKVVVENSLDIAKALEVEVFPEVVLLDQKAQILYKGAIDSRVKEIGNTYFRPAENEEYLKIALKQIQQNQPISIQNYPAKGCYIEFGKKH